MYVAWTTIGCELLCGDLFCANALFRCRSIFNVWCLNSKGNNDSSKAIPFLNNLVVKGETIALQGVYGNQVTRLAISTKTWIRRSNAHLPWLFRHQSCGSIRVQRKQPFIKAKHEHQMTLLLDVTSCISYQDFTSQGLRDPFVPVSQMCMSNLPECDWFIGPPP